jgi:biopolymer transport protein ExbD
MGVGRKMMSEVKGEMDMTPMIDIVFQLITFFMIAADLQQKELADLTLPIAYMAEEDKDKEVDERLILNVDWKGVLYHKGKSVSLDELGTILRNARDAYELKMKRMGKSGMEDLPGGAKASKLYVLLRADKDTPWQHVQWLMTVMAEQKLYKMQFATRRFMGGVQTDESKPGYRPGEQERLGGIDQKAYQQKFPTAGKE